MTEVKKRKAVLVVEDEAIVRSLAVEVVKDAGFEPVEAVDADQAIKILENRPDIRIVFTDVDMPGSMNGLKLAFHARRRWPPVEFIITTGAFLIHPGAMPERAVFIPKPYSLAQLTHALSRWA